MILFIGTSWRNRVAAVALGTVLAPWLAGGATLHYAGHVESRSVGGFVTTTVSQIAMRFAILDDNKVIWTSSSTQVVGPDVIRVPVRNGEFEITLGEQPTLPIPDASIPSTGFVKLRVWIGETAGSLEQLTDQTYPVGAFVKESDKGVGNWRLTGTVLTTRGVSRVGIGVDQPGVTLDVGGEIACSQLSSSGLIRTKVLEILGGSDLAESFQAVSGEDATIRPGMVVVASEREPGKVELTTRRGDPRVLGVVSGAGGVSPGLILQQDTNSLMSGLVPVALVGRVWCWADADKGSIAVGDELRASERIGMAEKCGRGRTVTTFARALTPLRDGQGLVLVLLKP